MPLIIIHDQGSTAAGFKLEILWCLLREFVINQSGENQSRIYRWLGNGLLY